MLKIGMSLGVLFMALVAQPTFAHDNGYGSYGEEGYSRDYGRSGSYGTYGADSLEGLAQYAGTYELHHAKRGACEPSISIGMGSSYGALSVGAYSFPAINGGWRWFERDDGMRVHSMSSISFSLFSRRPTLRNHMEIYSRSGCSVRREVEVRALRNGLIEVETESHGYGRWNKGSSKCFYAKSAAAPVEPGQDKDQGKDQGKDLGNTGQGGDQGNQGDLGGQGQ